MTTEVLTQTLAAGVQATFGQGRVWYLIAATAPVSVIAQSTGSAAKVRKFLNISQGFKFTADEGDGWNQLLITSATAQNITLVVGDDDVEFANAVTVGNTVTSQDLPSGTITASVADTPVATGTAAAIAANVSRRRITIGSLSTNTGSIRLQSHGAGANKGLELQPGLYVELMTTAAIDVRNDSGASQSFWTLEES